MDPHLPSSDESPSIARSRALLLFQCLVMLLVVRLLHIEERRGLFSLLVLVTGGVLLFGRVAERWRSSVFLAVSLASYPLAFAVTREDAGSTAAIAYAIEQSAWLFGMGSVLIALAHLPLALPGRLGLIAVAAAGFVWQRSASMDAFWAIFGSIFMFRLWIYIRDMRRPSGTTWPMRLSYFFVLSNGFFSFFPILNFRTFRESFRPGDAAIAESGIAWIVRGIVHLLLYRVVKTFFLPSPIDLIDIESLALFLAANYALYLQVSGHFHIITGLLHLFGFGLPRTHDRYFLASSFSDIWRRINIYWKDFLNEHVFLPVVFALHRVPRSAAIVIGVLVTFVATWLLHSWQYFWLVGHFPVAGREAALWLSAGSLVAINSLWQYRAAARRTGPPQPVTALSALRRSLQVAGTFLTVSFFWACWTVPGFPQLAGFVIKSQEYERSGLLRLAAALLAAIAAGTIAQLVAARLNRRGIATKFALERSAVLRVGVLGLLLCLAIPLDARRVGPELSRAMAALAVEAPTASELGMEIEGYYEELAVANLQSQPLLSIGRQQADFPVMWSEVTRERNDIIETEMIPGWNGTLAGVPFEVNRWGMRDDDVPRHKPPGTFRVAVVGSSATMGWGVPADADFESLVEGRLDASPPAGQPQIELLNFSTGGYTALQWAAALPEKVFPLEPDAVWYVAHQAELFGPPRHLTMCYEAGYAVPFACLDDLLREAGVSHEQSWQANGLLIERRAHDVLECIYRGIVAECRDRGVVAVYVYLPMPGIDQIPASMDGLLMTTARKAGFQVVDLSGWSAGRDATELMMDGHHHPTAAAHAIIADRFTDALRSDPAALGIAPEALFLKPEPSR